MTPPSVVTRCAWVPPSNPLYVAYHDLEWGVPVHDDRTMFEFLVLEGAQAGLSWATILHKRENYRRAFDGFDIATVAGYDDAKVAALLADAGIVRNRLKIAAAITNARECLRLQDEFGSLDACLWQFVGGKPIQYARRTLADIPAVTPEAEAMSKFLRKAGLKFVGPTLCYSHMQAVGMVNDHTVDCFRYEEVRRMGE